MVVEVCSCCAKTHPFLPVVLCYCLDTPVVLAEQSLKPSVYFVAYVPVLIPNNSRVCF